MKLKTPITQEKLKDVLHYELGTGEFLWRKDRNSRAKKGDRAGYIRPDGYVIFNISGGGTLLGHRLAWLYVHGDWPSGFIDHANGNKSDNRIANLRPATRAQNNMNKGPGASNKSGVKGVSKDSNGKWHAYIGIDGRLHSLGRFEALDEAAATRVAAERELFGEFARCA